MATGRKAISTRRATSGALSGQINVAAHKIDDHISTIAESNPIIAEGRSILSSVVDSVTDSIASAGAAALSTATAALAKLSYSGATGNFDSALEYIECTLTYFDVSEDNSDNIGSPCRKRLTLSSLSGFCQCEGAKVELGCTEVEQQAVETFLNMGVFIE